MLQQLTIGEKVSLAAGSDTWHTTAITRLGIPAIKVTDGPNGARGAGTAGTTSACIPCGTALGATWDPELVREVGVALAQEARSKSASVLLAPTLNNHRHPLAGRNFECLSEDPFLTSRIGAAYIAGVQSQGVAATAKHFVCNDSEFERMTISSEVGERALREIYLPPFEAAVHEAGAWAMMAAYNRINGTYAAEHAELLLGLLKGEWGFDGLLMSDWFGTKSTVGSAIGGLDLEMPGPPIYFGEKLYEAVVAGKVSEADVDDKVRRLLRLAARTGALDQPAEAPEQTEDRPEHRALIRRAASEAAVLLRNEGALLPLHSNRPGILAIIGPNGDRLAALGGGSARVEPHYLVSAVEGISAGAGPAIDVRFEPGCRIYRRTPALERGLRTSGADGPVDGATVEFFDNTDLAGEPVLREVVQRLQFTWVGNFAAKLGEAFSARVQAAFIPQDSGAHRLTLTSAGLSRLLLDGSLLVDNWTEQQRGASFYGRGSAEAAAIVELVAGESHNLVVEYRSPPRGGVRGLVVGCLPPEPPDQFQRAVELAAVADAVVLVVGLDADWETEGADRVDMNLPGEQDELIRRVAAVNQRTVVVVNAGSPVTMPWADEVGAILQLWYPGQEGGNALADVLFGRTDPGGRLPTTFPVRVEDAPSHLTYPGELGAVVYGEGVFVGYRGYDRRRLAPRFPFGHGLSYTAFTWGPLQLGKQGIAEGEQLEASISVRNTGSRRGSEVVQVYVRDVESSLLRPEKELKGFAKLALDPGEERVVRIILPPRAFAAWDPARHDWLIEPGEFEILAAASATDIRSRATVMLGSALVQAP